MATSGTSTFDPDVTEVLEEAFDCAGYEGRSGYEFRSAIRSLDRLMVEWANEGLNLWAVDSGTIPLVAGDSQYDLPADTIDIIDQKIRLNGMDYALERIGVATWASINDKAQPGERPTQVWVERLITPRVNLWPVPNSANASLVYWRLRRMQDAGDPGNTLDVPYRFQSALVAGLAFHLYRKRKDADLSRLAMMKADYRELLEQAKGEDRDRAPFIIRPWAGYRR